MKRNVEGGDGYMGELGGQSLSGSRDANGTYRNYEAFLGHSSIGRHVEAAISVVKFVTMDGKNLNVDSR